MNKHISHGSHADHAKQQVWYTVKITIDVCV